MARHTYQKVYFEETGFQDCSFLESEISSEEQKSATKQDNTTGVEKTKVGVTAAMVNSAKLESSVSTTKSVEMSIGGPNKLADGTSKKSEEKGGYTVVHTQQTKVDQTVENIKPAKVEQTVEDIKPAEENLDPLVLLRLYTSQECVSSWLNYCRNINVGMFIYVTPR